MIIEHQSKKDDKNNYDNEKNVLHTGSFPFFLSSSFSVICSKHSFVFFLASRLLTYGPSTLADNTKISSVFFGHFNFTFPFFFATTKEK